MACINCGFLLMFPNGDPSIIPVLFYSGIGLSIAWTLCLLLLLFAVITFSPLVGGGLEDSLLKK